MELPKPLLESLQAVSGYDRIALEAAHSSGKQITSIRINPLKPVEIFPGKKRIPWTEYGYYLEERPSFTFDPLFHAGAYYVQEASSMFIETILRQSVDLKKKLKVLDLSAAPGGKSTHLQSLISPESLLVSNEVIRSRANILKDNIIRWGGSNVVVTNNDPRDFSRLTGFFDVILVDAPCSGSGLFRKDENAVREWSEDNVMLCSRRQQRILEDIWPALKPGGILMYSTCSFSPEENENILEWLEKRFEPECSNINKNEEGIVEVEVHGLNGYRFWPDKIQGEGFFIGCIRKKDEAVSEPAIKKVRIDKLSKPELKVVQQWVQTDNMDFIRHENTVYAWPEALANDFENLRTQLKVIHSGTRVGELIRDKLIPDHALAMSLIVDDKVTAVELNYDIAIAYLQRKELKDTNLQKGWQLVKYKGKNLGWINVLSNRINNYYPKELRILKESNTE